MATLLVIGLAVGVNQYMERQHAQCTAPAVAADAIGTPDAAGIPVPANR